MFDRVGHPAKGRDGGKPARPAASASTTARCCAARAADGRAGRPPPGPELPGGGGYGDPAQRDPAPLEADLRNGYVSPRKRRGRPGGGHGEGLIRPGPTDYQGDLP